MQFKVRRWETLGISHGTGESVRVEAGAATGGDGRGGGGVL
jgi:hypothetical protein